MVIMNENEQSSIINDLCKNCQQLNIANNEIDTSNSSNSIEKCAKWLVRNPSISNSDDSESICSETSNLSKFSEECECSSGYSEEITSGNKEVRLYGGVDNNHYDMVLKNSVNSYSNVSITKSKNVHLGNVTYINGPVYVNQTANIVNNQTIINQYITNTQNGNGVKPPRILSRMAWLAQPPLAEYEIRKKPAKIVIITHSATDQAATEADNVLLVRLIQQFHVESRKWDDIGYNFLAGADGNVYEGRGWNAVGAHTYGYNKISIGICIIGYYVHKLPPPATLNNVKRLIEYGVEIGAIDENYQLLAHSQCSTTQSPGEKLYRDIQTWKNWDGGIDINNPPEEVKQFIMAQDQKV